MELEKQIEGIAPPPTPEEDSYMHLGICYEAMLIVWAGNRELTIKALQAITLFMAFQQLSIILLWCTR
ncbi:hypothetical protein [Nostoc sp.]|uniref:hypothetical protein n=1 Tax=Nostoc sp. TaxID=1180 RepID=UPI002FF79D61